MKRYDTSTASWIDANTVKRYDTSTKSWIDVDSGKRYDSSTKSWVETVYKFATLYQVVSGKGGTTYDITENGKCVSASIDREPGSDRVEFVITGVKFPIGTTLKAEFSNMSDVSITFSPTNEYGFIGTFSVYDNGTLTTTMSKSHNNPGQYITEISITFSALGNYYYANGTLRNLEIGGVKFKFSI